MWIFFIIIAIAAALVVGMYNVFVRGKNFVREAWSGIDVQLKRRHDLIPNLVKVVEEYAVHERTTLEKVTELRLKAIGTTDMKDRVVLEKGITQALKNIFVAVEAYPNLKANENFLGIQQALMQVEDDIQLARRYYNGTVRNYNISIESFPNNLLARLFHFERKDFFEIESAVERAVPQVKL